MIAEYTRSLSADRTRVCLIRKYSVAICINFVLFAFLVFSEDSNFIRRRRRRVDQPYGVGVGVGVASLHDLHTGVYQKSPLEPGIFSHSSLSPVQSSKPEELSRQSSTFKNLTKVTSDSNSHFLQHTATPAPIVDSSSRSSGDEHRHSPRSRAILRLTAESGTHFLQARRNTSSAVAASKEQVSQRFETRKSPSPPSAFPRRKNNAERLEAPSPSKLKANPAFR